jgi:hypothetical protein
MGVTRAKALLKRTAVELTAGKELTQEKKKKLKKIKDPVAAANIKRELESAAGAAECRSGRRRLW